jgi:hypothetical protein
MAVEDRRLGGDGHDTERWRESRDGVSEEMAVGDRTLGGDGGHRSETGRGDDI